jgi:phosphoribulokinase
MRLRIVGRVVDRKNSRVFQLLRRVLLQHSSDTRFLIGITGAGGAGKTTLANNIADFIGRENALPIDLDDYLRHDRAERIATGMAGYHPEANRLGLARRHLVMLLEGLPVTKPRYDHGTGRLLSDETVHPKPVIIAEGATALYPHFRGLHHLTFFLDAPPETQLKSRLSRDVNDRGYTPELAMRQLARAMPAYRRFVEPTKRHADLIYYVGTDYVLQPRRIRRRLLR